MNKYTKHVCTDCSTAVPARSYRATCPNCQGDLAPGDHDPYSDHDVPSFLRYGDPVG
jgi:hypothetical protein